jgi:mRNA interferase MazF
VSELVLTAAEDGIPSDCVVNFDNVHAIPRDTFRRRVTSLRPPRMAQVCRALRNAMGC